MTANKISQIRKIGLLSKNNSYILSYVCLKLVCEHYIVYFLYFEYIMAKYCLHAYLIDCGNLSIK